MACSNMSGSIKLPLLVIGVSNNPKSFTKRTKEELPVVYVSQPKAWMDSTLFSDWFDGTFVPYVLGVFRQRGIEEKILYSLTTVLPTHQRTC